MQEGCNPPLTFSDNGRDLIWLCKLETNDESVSLDENNVVPSEQTFGFQATQMTYSILDYENAKILPLLQILLL